MNIRQAEPAGPLGGVKSRDSVSVLIMCLLSFLVQSLGTCRIYCKTPF